MTCLMFIVGPFQRISNSARIKYYADLPKSIVGRDGPDIKPG